MKKPDARNTGPGHPHGSTSPRPASRRTPELETGRSTGRVMHSPRCDYATARAAVLERQNWRLVTVQAGPQGSRQWAICGFARCLFVILQALSTWPKTVQTSGVLEQSGRSNRVYSSFALGRISPVSSLALMLACTHTLFASSFRVMRERHSPSRILRGCSGTWQNLPMARSFVSSVGASLRSLMPKNSRYLVRTTERGCEHFGRVRGCPGSSGTARFDAEGIQSPYVNCWKSGLSVRAAQCFLIQRNARFLGVHCAKV
jgi:hypothetical protein